MAAAACEQVGLAAEKGGDLQDVDDLGHRRALAGVVDVGEDRAAEARLDLGQDGDALGQADAAGAAGAGPVRLVERALEDEGDAELAGQRHQPLGHHQRVRAALDGAGPGNEGQRPLLTDDDAADR